MGKTERSKWAGAHESTRATSEFQLLLTYSTLFDKLPPRRAGKGRLRRAARAAGFLQVERRIATLLRFFAGDTPVSTAVRLMHRSLLRRANVGYGGPGAAYDTCG